MQLNGLAKITAKDNQLTSRQKRFKGKQCTIKAIGVTKVCLQYGDEIVQIPQSLVEACS